MVYGFSSFLSLAAEVKSEFMLERFEDFPKDCDFIKKYSESITIYQKYSLKFAVSKLLQRPFILHCKSVKKFEKANSSTIFFVLCLGKFFRKCIFENSQCSEESSNPPT